MYATSGKERIVFPISSYAWRITCEEAKNSDPSSFAEEEQEIVYQSNDNLASFIEHEYYQRTFLEKGRKFLELDFEELKSKRGDAYLRSSMFVHRLLRNHTGLYETELPVLTEDAIVELKNRQFEPEKNRRYLDHLYDEEFEYQGFIRTLVRELLNPVSRRFYISLAKSTFQDWLFFRRYERVMAGVVFNLAPYRDSEIRRDYIKGDPSGAIDMYFAYKLFSDKAASKAQLP